MEITELEALLQTVRANPADSRYPELAEVLLQAGRYEDAIEFAERGLAQRPDPSAAIVLADASLQLGRTDQASAIAGRAVISLPDDSRVLRILGECQLRSGRADLALPLLKRAAAAAPQDPRAVSLLEQLEPAAPTRDAAESSGWDLGTMELGDDDAQSPSADFASEPPEPSFAGSLKIESASSDAADLELDLGGPPVAGNGDQTELDSGPVFDPAQASPVRSASMSPAASRRGSSSKASRLVPYAPPNLARERRRRLIPLAAGALFLALLIGGYLVRQNLRASAIEAQLQIARAAVLADTSRSLVKGDKAVQEALRRDPEQPEALALGAYLAARQFEAFDGGTDALVRAEDRLAVAETLASLRPLARTARAMLLIHEGSLGESIEVLSSGLQESPGNAWLLWQRGIAEWKLERLSLAIETLQSAHARTPELLALIPDLGRALQAKGDRAQAIELLSHTVDLAPSHLVSLGILLRIGRGDKRAREGLLMKAVAAAPTLGSTASPTELCRIELAAAKLAVSAGRPDLASGFEDGAIGALAEPSCRLKLAALLWLRGRYTEASDVFAALSEATRQNSAAAADGLLKRAALAALLGGRSARAASLIESLPEGTLRSQLQLQMQLDHAEAGKFGRALAPLIRGASPAPRSLLIEAEHLRRQGKVALARRAVLRAARREKSDKELGTEIAASLLLQGEARAATALMNRLARARSEPVPENKGLAAAPWQPGVRWFAVRSEAALLSGRRAAGLAGLEKALALNPYDDRSYELYRVHAPAARREAYLTRLSPTLANAMHAEIEIAGGKLPAASDLIEGLEDTTVVSAAAVRVSGLRAYIKVLREGTPNGLSALKQLAQEHPASAFVHRTLAAGLLHLGKLGEAIKISAKSSELGAYSIEARLIGVEARCLGGTPPDEALLEAQRLVTEVSLRSHSPLQRARALAALAIAQSELNQLEASKRTMQAALKKGGEDPRVLYAEGRRLEASGKIPKAVVRYQQAATYPLGESALLRMGILGADGVVPAALAKASLKRFLELAPGHAQAARARSLIGSL